MIGVAVLLAAEVARLTTSRAVSENNPELADRLAPHSASALTATAMAEVGQAAATASEPGPETLERFARLSAVAPLQPEPFLVHGALAARSGDTERAERLLLSARHRHPRSVAARYLLADLWLREGKLLDALKELAVLARLAPGSAVELVPALAEFAQTPGASAQLQPIVASNPSLKKPLLTALATDPRNADLILSLAGSDLTSLDRSTHSWKVRLLTAVIATRDYERAYDIWRRMAGLPDQARPLLFNPGFQRHAAPPPFNWRFISSAAGVAEPEGGRLRVLYYARENTTLASQLLLLPPGRYRFQAPASGNLAKGALSWRVSCARGARELTRMAASEARGTFEVPGDCGVQRLELLGTMQDMPKDSDIQVGPVLLERVTG